MRPRRPLPVGLRAALAAALITVTSSVSACGGGSTTSNTGASPDTSAVIAKVGAINITQHHFDIRLTSALTSLRQGGAATPKSSADPMFQQVRASVMRGLIDDAAIAQEASMLHVAMTDSQIDAQVKQDAAAAGGEPALETQLAQAGGSLDQLRDEVMAQGNEQNVEDHFAQQRAAAVVAALSSGQPFSNVATQYSDDQISNSKGGDLGAVTLATLDGSDPLFKQAVVVLHVGQRGLTPARDQAGYEILQLDATTPTSYSLHRILIAAPKPYTIANRPQWFAESLLQEIASLCVSGDVHVYLDASLQPCTAASPASTPSPK